MKFTNSGVIQSSKESNFSAAIDAFHGNSGAPVFNKTTNKANGILVAGQKDYSTENMVTVYHRVKEGERFETCQKISAISQEAIDKIYRANHPKVKKVKRKISKKEQKTNSQSHQLAAQTPKVEELYANWVRNNKRPLKRAKQVHASSKKEVDPVCEVCIIF